MTSATRASARLVVVEGIDGSGKSGIAERLRETCTERGVDAVLTREPTHTAIGEALKAAIRDPSTDPVAEAFLFMADHAQHVAWIERELATGRTVVSDRYSDSCYAYQGALLEARTALGAKAIDWLIETNRPFNRAPDVAILLDLDAKRAMARISSRGERIKFEEPAFLERVRANYRALAKRFDYYEVVDAAMPPEAVLSACVEALERRGILPRPRQPKS